MRLLFCASVLIICLLNIYYVNGQKKRYKREEDNNDKYIKLNEKNEGKKYKNSEEENCKGKECKKNNEEESYKKYTKKYNSAEEENPKKVSKSKKPEETEPKVKPSKKPKKVVEESAESEESNETQESCPGKQKNSDNCSEDDTDETEESEEVSPKRKQVTYVKKFAHEKNAKKKKDEDESILRIHRGTISKKEGKNVKKKYRQYDSDEDSEEDALPKRFQLAHEDDEE